MFYAQADIHAITQKGDTALTLATKNKNTAMIAIIEKALAPKTLADETLTKQSLADKNPAPKKLMIAKPDTPDADSDAYDDGYQMVFPLLSPNKIFAE